MCLKWEKLEGSDWFKRLSKCKSAAKIGIREGGLRRKKD